MNVFAPVAAAFESKDKEIKEIEEKIRDLTSSLSTNVELVKQRDQEISRLNSSLKQLTSKIETAKENEALQQAKVNRMNLKCVDYEKQIAQKLEEEEKAQKMLNEAKAEYEAVKEAFDEAKTRIQEEEAQKLQEYQDQKNRLVNSIKEENEKIAELQAIAQKMRNQLAMELEKITSDHVQTKNMLDAQIKELEKSNAELSETLRVAQQRARSEISERERQLTKLMNEKDQMEKERTAESNAKIQTLQIDLEKKKGKLVQLQNEVQTLIQSQKSREEGIEQIRIRYQESEQQNMELVRNFREKKRKQKLEISRLNQMYSEAKAFEDNQKKKVLLIQKEQYQNQEEYQKYQQAISEHQAVLEKAYNDVANKTEISLNKLKEAENIFRELQNRELDLKARAKSAAEELQRQHNEAIRVKRTVDDKKATLTELKGSIARIRAERKEKFTNPRLSVIEIPPQTNVNDKQSNISIPMTPIDAESLFNIPTANQDIFNLSPISSLDQNFLNQQSGEDPNEGVSQSVAQLASQLEDLKQTYNNIISRVVSKREQIAAMTIEGSELDNLRKENEALKQKKAEMDEMKAEIDRLRQNRPQM